LKSSFSKTSFNKIDKSGQYFTVSKNGVTSFTPHNQPELISLAKWESDRKNYNLLRKVKKFIRHGGKQKYSPIIK
jgi:hypothetical protein